MKAFKGLIEQKDLIGSLVSSGNGVVLYRASVKSEAAAAEEWCYEMKLFKLA